MSGCSCFSRSQADSFAVVLYIVTPEILPGVALMTRLISDTRKAAVCPYSSVQFYSRNSEVSAKTSI
jgi:hypothetical protein